MEMEGDATPPTQPPTLAPTGAAVAPPAKAEVREKKPPRPRKVWDPLLDGWYYNEINRRHNKDAELFKNYQINPFTKKTLQYVTPKITERRQPLPDHCAECYTDEEQKLAESYNLVKRSMDKSVFPPKCRFCEPQTELMRLGWFDDPPPPIKARTCMFLLPPWKEEPCCYYYPTPESDLVQNENYDERFRATHQTAEFIRTATMLRKYDAIMNPDGFRGKVKTAKRVPGSYSSTNKGTPTPRK